MASSVEADGLETLSRDGSFALGTPRVIVWMRLDDAELQADPAAGRRWMRGALQQLRDLATHALIPERPFIHGARLLGPTSGPLHLRAPTGRWARARVAVRLG